MHKSSEKIEENREAEKKKQTKPKNESKNIPEVRLWEVCSGYNTFFFNSSEASWEPVFDDQILSIHVFLEC